MIIAIGVGMAAAGAATLGWLAKDSKKSISLAKEMIEERKDDLLNEFDWDYVSLQYKPKNEHTNFCAKFMKELLQKCHLKKETAVGLIKSAVKEWEKERRQSTFVEMEKIHEEKKRTIPEVDGVEFFNIVSSDDGCTATICSDDDKYMGIVSMSHIKQSHFNIVADHYPDLRIMVCPNPQAKMWQIVRSDSSKDLCEVIPNTSLREAALYPKFEDAVKAAKFYLDHCDDHYDEGDEDCEV